MNKHITIDKQILHLNEKKKISNVKNYEEEISKFLSEHPYEYTINEIKQFYRDKNSPNKYVDSTVEEYLATYKDIKNVSFKLLDEILEIEALLKSQVIYYVVEKKDVNDGDLFNKKEFQDSELKKAHKKHLKIEDEQEYKYEKFYIYINMLSFNDIVKLFVKYGKNDCQWFNKVDKMIRKKFRVYELLIQSVEQNIKTYKVKCNNDKNFEEFKINYFENIVAEDYVIDQSLYLGKIRDSLKYYFEDVDLNKKKCKKPAYFLQLEGIAKKTINDSFYDLKEFREGRNKTLDNCKINEDDIDNISELVFNALENEIKKSKKKEELEKTGLLDEEYLNIKRQEKYYEEYYNAMIVLKNIRDNICHGRTFVNAIVIAKYNYTYRKIVLRYIIEKYPGNYPNLGISLMYYKKLFNND